jgi:hypothetical protein
MAGRDGATPSRIGLLVCGAIAAIAVTGCGSNDHSGRGRIASMSAGYPSPPTARECSSAALPRPDGPPTVAPPRPGVYSYDVRGTTAQNGRPRALSGANRVIVSPATDAANLRCDRVQTRLGNTGVVGTALVAIRGSQAFTLRADALSPQVEFRFTPSQPVPSGDSQSLDTSGSFEGTVSGRNRDVDFSGPVVGSYASDVIGRARVRVGSETVDAVQVEVRTAWRGQDITSRERSTNWVDIRRRLLVRQQVEQDLTSGGRRFKTSYTAKLRSMVPARCCSGSSRV